MAKKSLNEQLDSIGSNNQVQEKQQEAKIVRMLGTINNQVDEFAVIELHYDVNNEEVISSKTHSCVGANDLYDKFRILAITLGLVK